MNKQFVNDLATALRKVGTIHTVGEEWVSYIGEIPVGGVPYCGQMVTRETYSALWAYAQEKKLVKTEAEWQQIATVNNGNVPFYSSGDGSTTFRVPKLVGYVKGASSQSEAGDYIAEGLPNITGTSSGWDTSSTATESVASGAFSCTGSLVASTGSGTVYQWGRVEGFDASRSNQIYGKSSHVTPETSTVMFGVYAFGAIVETGALDATTLATSLARVESNLSGVVRSVNGTTADTSGNVTLTVSGSSAYQIPYATCSTGGSTDAKVATISNGVPLTLVAGAMVAVNFSNSPSKISSLNVNSTGAKSISFTSTTLNLGGSSLTITTKPNSVWVFVYNGSNWCVVSTYVSGSYSFDSD